MKTVCIVMVLFATLFAADGDLDPSFGNDGIVTIEVGTGAEVKSVAIQSDGKIVAVGHALSGGKPFATLVRYNTNGTLDMSFGSNGIVTAGIGGIERAESVAIQSDGKIVTVGRASYGGSTENFTLTRHNTDGTLDTSFGSGGIVMTGNGNAKSVVIQDDGKIIAAGSIGSNAGLARYNIDGTLDTSFGSDGIVTTTTLWGVLSLTIQGDGKIVAAGSSTEFTGVHYFALARYNTDGTLDTSFGSDGIVITIETGGIQVSARSVAIQSDGKIVASGNSDDGTSPWSQVFDFMVVRYNTDGTLDTSFGSGGIVKTDIGGNEEIAESVIIQGDGKIVAAGHALDNDGGTMFTLARYNTDGTLDASFGNGGIVTTINTGIGQSAAIQDDGKIILAGYYNNFILARYLASPIIPNTKPVAYAGEDQAVILLNTAVQLDGNGSYDEDGDTISYDWNMTQKPEGSSAALSDPSSSTPTFIPDVYGDYVIELTVSDPTETGSTDSVTISFDNVKPVANAGGNKSLLVGDTAVLDGTGSTDANGDPLTYSWSFVSKPAGSTATLSGSTSPTTSFVADTNGTYDISLIVNDGLLDSDPDSASILAITVVNAITQILSDTMNVINNIPPAALKNPNMANALTNKINAVLKMIEKEQYQGALNKLTNDILTKTDGCANAGDPDQNDWIITCAEQDAVYSLIMEAIGIVQNQI